MSLFSSSPTQFLGIDFGTQSIKAVEIKIVKGKSQLVNYGWVNISDTKEAPDVYDNNYAKLLTGALKALIKEMKPHAKTANVAIPSFNGLVMIVDFPKMNEKEVAEAIKFESRKYIPASLDEVNVNWEILDDGTDSEKSTNKKNKKELTEAEKELEAREKKKKAKDAKMKVLLVAAPKSEVRYYDELFKDMDIMVDTLEIESFALARSVVGNTKGRFVLVDFGAKTTNVILVVDGIVHVSRSIDVGGVDVTKAIMKSLDIARDRAIALKESGENFFTGTAKVNFPSLNYIANEVNRVVSVQKNNRIESLVLCGGGSKLVGLPEYLEQLTGLKVIKGNALSRVSYDREKSGKIEELSGAFAVAIGLALRGVEENKK